MKNKIKLNTKIKLTFSNPHYRLFIKTLHEQTGISEYNLQLLLSGGTWMPKETRKKIENCLNHNNH